MKAPDPLAFMGETTAADRQSVLTGIGREAAAMAAEWDSHFALHAHPGQLPPEGEWLCWLIMAGRGFGKTRAGSEWVLSIADGDCQARIALVAASLPIRPQPRPKEKAILSPPMPRGHGLGMTGLWQAGRMAYGSSRHPMPASPSAMLR